MFGCSTSSLKLIIDLDGTVLFAEERPGALVIKGRRRNTFLATETIEALRGWELILATGRSISSTLEIKEAMEKRGLIISGAVAENGGIVITEETTYLTSSIWQSEISILKDSNYPYLKEFMTCLALLKPTSEELSKVRISLNQDHYLLQDGNKVFLLEQGISKRKALEYLLGDDLFSCCGIGNDLNDLDWLQMVAISAAPAGVKDEVALLVQSKCGIMANQTGHGSIPEIIDVIKARLSDS